MTIDPPKVHFGARNASTAVFISDKRFLVADDEDQQQTVLRLYDLNTGGPPQESFHLSNAVLEPDAGHPEIDLEGSARRDGRIYWIGSHSRNRKGKSRPSRQRLFATTMQDGSPVITGSPYKTLLRDVEAAIGKSLDKRVPPDEGGVSIEGLSATPSGGLLIAFRSPLVKKRALIIELKNPDEVIDHGTSAQFGDPLCLDLDGRGIRSLEYWPNRGSYLMIAGPPGGGCEEFALMRWSGPISTRPETLGGVCFTEFASEKCWPEGVLISSSNVVYILFDEGERTTGQESFRTIAIHDLLP